MDLPGLPKNKRARRPLFPSGNDNWINLEASFDRPDTWTRYSAGVLKYYADVTPITVDWKNAIGCYH